MRQTRTSLVAVLLAPLAALVSAVVPDCACTAEQRSVALALGPVWIRHTIDDTSLGADGVKLGDINRDGLRDLVTAWEEGGEVRVYLNPGHAKAREAWPRVTVGRVRSGEDAIFADLDGDGRLDVISCTEGKTRTVFWHRFTGNADGLLKPENWRTNAFPATLESQSWMQAVAMDKAPQSPGDLDGWQYHRLREAGWVMSLVAQDMDRDGDQDIVFSDRKGPRTGVFWLENPGAAANRQHAAWKEHAIGALGRQVMFVDLADVNSDGLLDVAAAVKPADIVLCLRSSNGGWQEMVLRLVAANLGDAKAVKAADVNGDGLTDFLFTCENARGDREGVVWLEQQRHGPWKQRPLGGPGGVKYDLMQVLDLDGDGDLDVITCEEQDQIGVVWYENPHRGGESRSQSESPQNHWPSRR